jgi:hypothetical protein
VGRGERRKKKKKKVAAGNATFAMYAGVSCGRGGTRPPCMSATSAAKDLLEKGWVPVMSSYMGKV